MNNVDDLWYLWEEICLFNRRYGDKKTINNYEANILDLKNPWLCCRFAGLVYGTDKKALEKVVIESKNPRYCYEFAKSV